VVSMMAWEVFDEQARGPPAPVRVGLGALLACACCAGHNRLDSLHFWTAMQYNCAAWVCMQTSEGPKSIKFAILADQAFHRLCAFAAPWSLLQG